MLIIYFVQRKIKLLTWLIVVAQLVSVSLNNQGVNSSPGDGAGAKQIFNLDRGTDLVSPG